MESDAWRGVAPGAGDRQRGFGPRTGPQDRAAGQLLLRTFRGGTIPANMRPSSTHRWFGLALVAGAAYFAIGRLFAWPTDHVRIWRLAAWGASAVVFALHVAYEHLRPRSTSRSAASHAAVAVAIGAFLLAFAGMLHAAKSGSGLRATWFLALVAWPAVTAVPAFCVAIVAVEIAGRLWPRSRRAR